MSPILKLILEIGPLAVFFIAFGQFKDLGELEGLIWATAAFMAALLVATAITYALTRTISRMAMVTTAIVLALGALTIWLRDDVFIKMKPTLVNGLFALALGVGLLRGQSYLKLLIGDLLPMEHEGWMKLTRNWMLFFAAMALFNEAVWRTQDTETWVWIKTFVYLPVTIVFTLAQTPLMSRYAIEEETSQGA